MSKGPGRVEQRIAELFAATRDRVLSIGEIADNAYELEGKQPTRAQRLAATRAAHRLLRRVRDTYAREQGLRAQGKNDRQANKLRDFYHHIGMWFRYSRVEGKPWTIQAEADFWQTTTLHGRLFFHPPDVPVRVWAVSLQPHGIVWAEAEVVRVTKRNVVVRYAGEAARLDRQNLWYGGSYWRGVRFVSSRTGRIAKMLDGQWWKRFGTAGGPPPSLQLPLADAMALLGVPEDYTREDVLTAFRRKAKRAHPDVGGTADMFRQLLEARDRLLAAIGTKAPPPKPPTYAPKGAKVIYRRVRSTTPRLGSQARARLA